MNINYDKDTGRFYALNGRRLDYHDKEGYYAVYYLGKKYIAHRLAWYLSYGTWPTMLIDHIDRDKGNNRLENLREVNVEGNQRNKGQRGYFFDKRTKKWRVEWSYNNNKVNVRSYSSEEEADLAYRYSCAGMGVW